MEQLLLLQQRANQLVRLVLRQVGGEIPKSMAGVLKLVAEHPMRVTEIAKLEGLAQPTVTALVNQAEQRGWVCRRADPHDGRVAQVAITPAGRRARKQLHRDIVQLLRARIVGMPDHEITELVAAADALVPLIEALQRHWGVSP